MRFLTFLSVVIILLFVFYLDDSSGDIKFSHHDFSGASWSNGEICIVCHTPHHANQEVSDSPLWNHQVTNAVFELYSSSTSDAVPGQPNGKSKLCLSCHDGTVAFENHSGVTSGTRFMNSGNVGTSLANDHPISFIYNSALANADGELYDPSTAPSGLGGTIAEDFLDNGSLECSSCHDVHISRNTQGCVGCHNVHGSGGVATNTLSLRVSNDGSGLCKTCHDK